LGTQTTKGLIAAKAGLAKETTAAARVIIVADFISSSWEGWGGG
jgi:hypothetical protein